MWEIYDFLDNRKKSVIRQWADGIHLETKLRAKLEEKIDLLRSGPDLSPGLLAKAGVKNIQKLRLGGHQALRPMLCLGPLTIEVNGKETPERAFTLLLGAEEKGGKLEPPDAPERASENRETLLADSLRREIHERLDS